MRLGPRRVRAAENRPGWRISGGRQLMGNRGLGFRRGLQITLGLAGDLYDCSSQAGWGRAWRRIRPTRGSSLSAFVAITAGLGVAAPGAGLPRTRSRCRRTVGSVAARCRRTPRHRPMNQVARRAAAATLPTRGPSSNATPGRVPATDEPAGGGREAARPRPLGPARRWTTSSHQRGPTALFVIDHMDGQPRS